MGKRTKIAPVLTKMVTCGSGWALGTESDEQARRELRAMKAVVSAVGRYRRVGSLAPGIACLCQGQGVCAGCSLERALARLSRASGGGER